MLSEEALILAGALVVVALLVLGVLELLWPTRSRRPPLPPRAALPRAAGVAPRAEAGLLPALPGAKKADAPLPRTGGGAAAVGVRAGPAVQPAAAPVDEAAPATGQAPAPVPPPAATTRAIARAEPGAADAETDASPAGRCARLLAEERYAEAVALAHAALAGAPGLAPADRGETARLWSLMARACWGHGDGDGARRAMESAIGAAPAADVAGYQREFFALARDAATRLLDDAAAESAPPARLATLREALAWTDAAESVGAGDADVASVAVDVQAALWPAWEQAARSLLQRQEFRSARRLLREALADRRLPPERRETFAALLRRSYGGEVGQLTAQAVRSIQQARDADALGCLRRADRLLAALDEDVLPPQRREELHHRVWWSYARLGTRRLEAGEFEAALEPLFQALRFEPVAAGEGAQARAALRQALDRVVEAHAAAIRRHVDTGDRDAALDANRRLWRLLEAAGERGLGEDDLGEIRGAAQRVTRELDAARRG